MIEVFGHFSNILNTPKLGEFMKVKILRSALWHDYTLGQMFINERYVCDTLEPPVREEKIPGSTAIPYGRYQVEVTHSPKFKRRLPLIKNVTNFEGVRIHRGNSVKDTSGCVLVGEWDGNKSLVRSIVAEVAVTMKMEEAKRRGEDIILIIE